MIKAKLCNLIFSYSRLELELILYSNINLYLIIIFNYSNHPNYLLTPRF
jgi:hypothetical protein